MSFIFDQQHIDDIARLLSEGKLLIGEMIGADFCHDQYPGADFVPDAVVEAVSTEEVAAIIKLCYERGVPVTVRGAGTGQVGGSVPVKGGIVLSVKGMDRVVEYNSDEKILRVQTGVLLQDVKIIADSNSMYYPPDPGELTATIGGNVATNASGPCAVKYGKTCDYVVDAIIVLADGTVTTLEGNEEIIGCEGTLGVITEVSLKLIEKPGADAILLFPFKDIESAVAGAKVILTNNFDPAVVELMDTDIIEFSGKVTGNPVFPLEMDGERVGATLMVIIEGADDDDVMEKMEAVAALTEEGELECIDILVGDTIVMKRDFWAAHSAFHTSIESGAKSAYEINVDVPIDAAAEMIEFAKETAEANELKAYIHSHLASGGMHIHLASEKRRDESKADAKAFSDIAYAKVIELGGDIVGEYGVGYVKAEYLPEAKKAEYATKKAKFNPKGILNPGKII